MPIVHHARQKSSYPDDATSSQIALSGLPIQRRQTTLQVMPDDHSASVPPLPIPNRTVKRRRADDSAATSVKVGYRQACSKKRPRQQCRGRFALHSAIYRPAPPPSLAPANRPPQPLASPSVFEQVEKWFRKIRQ